MAEQHITEQKLGQQNKNWDNIASQLGQQNENWEFSTLVEKGELTQARMVR